MIRLLGRQTSGNVQKVIFLLEEAKLAYEREDYGRQFGNTGTAEYLAMNPAGKVPTLVDDGAMLFESNTILRYLADTHAPVLTGATPAERAAVECWMDFLLAAINPGYMAAFKGAKLPPEDRAPGYEGQISELVGNLAILDTHLSGKSFFALERLTLADIAMGPIVKRCLGFPIDRPSMTALEAWLASLEGRPAFQTATAG